MAPALARNASLRQHLAFDKWRQEKQSVVLAGELLSMLYTTYLLVAHDVTDEGLEIMVAAETALQRGVTGLATEPNACDARRDDAVLEAILAEHDRLLRVTPQYVFLAAKLRLHRLYEDGNVLSLAAVLAAASEET